MLAHLKIMWQLHAVHQKVSRFFGPRYIGDDFFLGPNLVSFNRNRNYSAIQLSVYVQSVPITTKVVSSNPANGEVYSIQHYVIKFVSESLGPIQCVLFPHGNNNFASLPNPSAIFLLL